jgi:molybdopterin-guanine dinucleotide biosynthesis protein A
MPKNDRARDVTGVVIAGGRSSRMDHREKALLDLAGEPMIKRVVERLRPQVGRMVINANGDPKRFAQFGLPIFADTIEGHEGPLAGLQAGLQWARAETPDARFIASVAADKPFIPEDLVARLLAALKDAGASSAIASSGGEWTPVVGVWSVALSDTLAEALRQGVRAVHRFATEKGGAVVEFPFVEIGGEPIDPFFNVNTPDDVATADRVAKQQANV